MTKTNGWVADGFERVADVFQKNFDEGREVGAAYAAYLRGEKVVDLWGGIADVTTGRPWEEDTMELVYSTSKGMTAMCANRLAQQGLLDVSAPVATYWPEFAQHGKDAITVADLLSHRAGLAWVDAPVTLEGVYQWDPVIRALEAQAPSWKPGTAHGYHATTYGWLVGEVIRRITGKSVGTYLREEICTPLDADAYIGLPADKEPRVARLVSFLDALGDNVESGLQNELSRTDEITDPAMKELAELAKTFFAPGGNLFKALTAPGNALGAPGIWNTPELHAAEIPAANGICDARSLARLYGACVSDVVTASGEKFRILAPEQLSRALEQETEGPDQILLELDIQWGLGFMLNKGIIGNEGMGGPRSFGHFGMGGSSGWADPDLELGTGYVMNKMDMGVTGDSRSFSLFQATAEAAAKR